MTTYNSVYQLPHGNIEASTPMVCLTDEGFKADTRYVARTVSGEACEFATLTGAEHYLEMCHDIQLMKQRRAAVTHQRYDGPFHHPLIAR